MPYKRKRKSRKSSKRRVCRYYCSKRCYPRKRSSRKRRRSYKTRKPSCPECCRLKGICRPKYCFPHSIPKPMMMDQGTTTDLSYPQKRFGEMGTQFPEPTQNAPILNSPLQRTTSTSTLDGLL